MGFGIGLVMTAAGAILIWGVNATSVTDSDGRVRDERTTTY